MSSASARLPVNRSLLDWRPRIGDDLVSRNDANGYLAYMMVNEGRIVERNDPTMTVPTEFRPHLRRWLYLTGALILCFSPVLIAWVRFCLAEDLNSYALLVPAISAWLIWQRLEELRFNYRPAQALVVVMLLLGGFIFLYSFAGSGTASNAEANKLCLRMLGFWLMSVGLGALSLGSDLLRQNQFPIAFSIFMVPIPPDGVHVIEVGLQHASAEVSGWLFTWTGASFLQHGLVFQLPNIAIEVAPECSGIRSTLVLFLTSLIAGQLFLKRSWQRALFATLVVPLGIARNAFRIVTIGWLCINYGPEMINSAIHRRGGPLFFALSLVPLFGVLIFLRWMNRRVPNSRYPAELTVSDASA